MRRAAARHRARDVRVRVEPQPALRPTSSAMRTRSISRAWPRRDGSGSRRACSSSGALLAVAVTPPRPRPRGSRSTLAISARCSRRSSSSSRTPGYDWMWELTAVSVFGLVAASIAIGSAGSRAIAPRSTGARAVAAGSRRAGRRPDAAAGPGLDSQDPIEPAGGPRRRLRDRDGRCGGRRRLRALGGVAVRAAGTAARARRPAERRRRQTSVRADRAGADELPPSAAARADRSAAGPGAAGARGLPLRAQARAEEDHRGRRAGVDRA